MALSQYEVDVSHSELAVYTFKEGFLSAMGHDLKIGCHTWTCTVTPRDEANLDISVQVDAKSLYVIGSVTTKADGTQTVTAMDSWSVNQIQKNMFGSYVLDTTQFPFITYSGNAVRTTTQQPVIVAANIGDDDNANNTSNATTFQVDGVLVLHGESVPLPITCTVVKELFDSGKVCIHLVGDVRLNQSQWKMEPFSTMFGAIRLKDEVHVSFNVTAVEKL
jgi:polyisoprenoid-binding protein YceI